MKLSRLHLLAFGPFTDTILDFGDAQKSLIIVHGPNEAGKSAMLRAMTDLRFGIPTQSKDNFIHRHPDMRIGGEFIARDGRSLSLLRTKGRKGTLVTADFSDGIVIPGDPVSPAVEHLLTYGLSRDSYETMFGLDHGRLREGGVELLSGKGQVGPALFQASAGVTSIRNVLAELENSARKYFMPGSRAKYGRINEALELHGTSQSAFKKAMIKPTEWAHLSKHCAETRETLAGLEARQLDVRKLLALAKELRAVAPMVRRLDQALAELQELRDVPLLSKEAETDRGNTQALLNSAQANEKTALLQVERIQSRLATITRDPRMVEAADAVERLASAAEALNSWIAERDEADADAGAARARLGAIAASIDPARTASNLLSVAPSLVSNAEMQDKIQAVETAEIAFEQQRESAYAQSVTSGDMAMPELPPTETLIALRAALEQIKTNDAMLKRLALLPQEIKLAERRLAALLTDLDLTDETHLRAVRPLLDATIVEAVTRKGNLDARQTEIEKRLGDFNDELNQKTDDRDLLLAGGEVPTREEVMKARAHRDVGWALIRAHHIESGPVDEAALQDFIGNDTLNEVYSQAVQRADSLADRFAADVQRAERLQACLTTIQTLSDKKMDLQAELSALSTERSEANAKWLAQLQQANLSAMEPASLGEWQTVLSKARVEADALQDKREEHERALETEVGLANTLRVAITATGLGTPADMTPLATLKTMAGQVDEEVRRREQEITRLVGANKERDRQAKLLEERGQILTAKLEEAHVALAPDLRRLLLPENASIATGRARLQEFDDLRAAQDGLIQAEANHAKANSSLARFTDQAQRLAVLLDETRDDDLRFFVDRMKQRLQSAKEAEREHELETQALAQVETTLDGSRVDVQSYTDILEGLCKAAQVENIDQLPAAEDASRRKYSAQEEVDRASREIGQASRRQVDELRILIGDKDMVVFDTEETGAEEDLKVLGESIGEARKAEEDARKALEAIDSGSVALAHREDMARAVATIDSSIIPWMRSRLAHALLTEALQQFRERAQGPMLSAATRYFAHMTGGAFVRLESDDVDGQPILKVERKDSKHLLGVEALSEGSRDQLYLALRLAALELQRQSGVDLPTVLDDVLMTSDDQRAIQMLVALEEFSRDNQVIVMTHHDHLVELAKRSLPSDSLTVVPLA
jgi:DNA repair protein SbcC/Rad50